MKMIKKIKEKIKVMKQKSDSKKLEKKKKQLDKEIKEQEKEKIPTPPKEEIETPIPAEVVEPPEIEPLEIEPPEKEKKGLVGQLKELNEKIDVISQKKKQVKKLKKKTFKMPFKVKSQLKKLAIKNKVMVLLLQENKNAMPTIGTKDTGMLLVGDGIYDGDIETVWLWQGKYPFHIVPEWDLRPVSKTGIDEMRKPLGTDELHQDTLKNNRLSYPERIILRAIEAKENLMLKGKASTKAIILTVVITIVIAAVLFSGGII